MATRPACFPETVNLPARAVRIRVAERTGAEEEAVHREPVLVVADIAGKVVEKGVGLVPHGVNCGQVAVRRDDLPVAVVTGMGMRTSGSSGHSKQVDLVWLRALTS